MISGSGRHIPGATYDHLSDLDWYPGDLPGPLHDDSDHAQDEEEKQNPAGATQDVQGAFCINADGIRGDHPALISVQGRGTPQQENVEEKTKTSKQNEKR